jgi:transcription elongation factor Elf1
MALRDYGGEEEKAESPKKKVFDEFDCPLCNANNPYGDGFMSGDEIRCYYCGSEFRVRVNEEGKMKLKEV